VIVSPFGSPPAAVAEAVEPAPAQEAAEETDVAVAPEAEPAAGATDTAPGATETAELAEAAPEASAPEVSAEAPAQTVAEGTEVPGEAVPEATEPVTVAEADADVAGPDADATAAEVAEVAPEPVIVAEPTPPAAPQAEVADAPEIAVAQAPSVVIAGPEGLRVVQGAGAAPDGGSPGAPPSVQTEVQLDAIAYNTEGEVILSGRGPADGRVQILLDNRAVELGEIGPGGNWSLDLPDVDPGTYTLSVEQLSPEGVVEARIDTPFLREDPARIAASPMQVDVGVSVITVQPGFTLWGIAEANFGEGIAYVQIFEENRDRIRDPDWIFPGQIFRLPDLPRAVNEE
jgi:nucleoid-associated protein YgaU